MLDLHAELNPRLLLTLRCPLCGTAMGVDDTGRSLRCHHVTSGEVSRGRSHLFDGGAGGYVHLAPGHGGGGDAKEAVRARSSFLGGGYYAPAARAIADLVEAYTPKGGLVLDAGCGEGYFSNHVSETGVLVMGVDLSKFAVDAAARAARRARRERGQPSSTLYAVGSVFDLPVAESSFHTVLNVFAPCAPREYARVLKPGGHLVVAEAGERHLFGLKELIYDDPYLNEPRRDLPAEEDGLRLLETRSVDFTITVDQPSHRMALFSMTPYYWRTPRNGHQRLLDATSLVTRVSFGLRVYQKA